jgi:opacity protein-like surface antigen
MKPLQHNRSSAVAARLLTVALLLAVLASASAFASAAPTMQLIPSVGFEKSTDANAANGKAFGGVALRASILPFLSVEGGIAYRQESFFDNDLTVRMWPVTASVWLNPVPMLYAGGGVGWYRTTYDLKDNALFKDITVEKIGVHLGGGLAVPLTPALGLDLNGRYIFMQKDNKLAWSTAWPTEFNPDFWNASVGLAIKF